MSEFVSPSDIEETPNSFVLIDSPEDLKKSVIARIAQINDLPIGRVSPQEIKTLYNNLRGSYYPNQNLFEKYLGNNGNLTIREINQQIFGQYVECLIGEASHCSYGIFAPSYFEKLLDYQNQHGEKYPCKSLLAGVLTINTLQEYLAVNHSVFPNSTNIAIDINTNGLHQSPDCLEVSALKTGFGDQEFDTIQTNILLRNLTFSKDKPFARGSESARFSFYEEAYRILKRYGRIIFAEQVYNLDTETNHLSKIGFTDIQTEPAKVFTDSMDLARLTRCSHGNFELLSNASAKPCDRVLIITATKR